jgi:hypothetical protein
MKSLSSWVLVIAGVLGVLVSYCAIWVLLAYFAAGIVWWANAALLGSGPIAAVGSLLARRSPRQRVAMWIGWLAFAGWALLWTLMFTVLGFKFNPGT